MSSLVEVQVGAEIDAELIRLRNERVMANQGLVWKVAKGLHGHHRNLAMERLVGLGNLGLIRAAELYDPGRGRFSTFAYYWIRRAIFEGLAEDRMTIRLPKQARSDVIDYREHVARLRSESGDAPGPDEVLDAMGIPRSRRANRRRVLAAVAVDHANSGESRTLDLGSAHSSTPSPLDSLVDREDRMRLADALDRLPEEYRRMLIWRYGLDGENPRTGRAICRLLGISDWEIGRRKMRHAIEELRKLMNVDLGKGGECDE